MNDEFCADEKKDSECREVKENRVSIEKSERRQWSWELREKEREESKLRVASLASLAIKKIA